MISPQDRRVIRDLAAKWMESAALPVMNERKRLWRAVHDLAADERRRADGRACGACDSCRLRAAGFAAAGVADPTVYR